MHVRKAEDLCAFLLPDVVDQILVDFREFIRQNVEELVGDVSLDHDLVFSGDAGAASELAGEEFAGHLEVDPEGAKSRDYSDCLLLTPGCIDSVILFSTSASFFLAFIMPLPPLFCLFFSS